MSDVTHILLAIEQGDPRAAEKLLPLVYDELRRLASAEARRRGTGAVPPVFRPGARGLSQARRRR